MTVAVIVLLTALAVYYLAVWLGQRQLRQKDGFVSPRAHEVYTASRAVLDQTRGGATYSDYKTTVPGADAVLFTDVRRLWREGRLTPTAVQAVM